MFGKLKLFLLESREEFNRVNWPKRNEAFKMVFVVIAISLITAIFLGTLDLAFRTLFLERII